MPDKSPKDWEHSHKIAKAIQKLVEAHQQEQEVSVREIQRRIEMEHPALSRIMKGKTYLVDERAKWSLFKLGRYFGADFGEEWLSPYINPTSPGWWKFDLSAEAEGRHTSPDKKDGNGSTLESILPRVDERVEKEDEYSNIERRQRQPTKRKKR